MDNGAAQKTQKAIENGDISIERLVAGLRHRNWNDEQELRHDTAVYCSYTGPRLLHRAIENGDRTVVRFLVQTAGRDPNSRYKRFSAVSYALEVGYPDIARELITDDFDLCDEITIARASHDALTRATEVDDRRKSVELVRTILTKERVQPCLENPGAYANLLECFNRVCRYRPDLVQAFVDGGVPLEPEFTKLPDDAEGSSPLNAAVMGANVHAVRTLLANGADPNGYTRDPESRKTRPIHVAALEYAFEPANRVYMNAILENLFDGGAQPIDGTDASFDSFNFCVEGNCARVLALFEKYGFPASAYGDGGKTAVFHALKNGARESLDVLMHQGLDPFELEPFEDGQTASEVALMAPDGEAFAEELARLREERSTRNAADLTPSLNDGHAGDGTISAGPTAF